jgi:hypothetical protein
LPTLQMDILKKKKIAGDKAKYAYIAGDKRPSTL